MSLRGAIVIGLLLSAMGVWGAELTTRQLFIDPNAPEGGDGSRERPYSSIQGMVDTFEEDRGYVFLEPGVYEEDVVINRKQFWFMPARQYDVVLRGSITVQQPGVIIRGMNILSEGSGIVIEEGAKNCRIQQNRIQSFGEGHAGIEVAAPGCEISDTIVDLRGGEGAGRAGIRVRVSEGVTGTRLDFNQVAGCETGIAFVGAQDLVDHENIASANRLLSNTVGLLIDASGVTARHNEFRSNTTGARITAGGALLAGNRFLGDDRAVASTGDGVVLESNVIAGSDAGVAIQGGVATLLHNTLHGASALLEVAEGARCDARWNILSGSDEPVQAAGELALSGNLYSRGAPETDADAIVGDPSFADPAHHDFRIDSDSPAAHAAGASAVRTDADGIGRPWGPAASIGAYEAPGEREGRSIHVAPGAEGGDGTPERPFGSIAAACSKARPGDRVLLANGEYEFGEETLECAGAPDAPIAIAPASADGATIVRSRLWLARCSYVHIEGLRFHEPPGGYITLGPHSRHNVVRNTVGIRESQGGGTGISVSGPGAQRNLFENNLVALNRGGVGLNISCQRYNWHQTIRGNDISGCYYGVQTGGGSYPTAPPGYHLIEGNVFHDNWKDGVHTKGTDQIIVGNHFYGNTGHAITTRYGARNVIVGNWIHNNGAGMRLHSPSHFVINNVIYNNRRWGIHASAWPGGQEAEWPYNFEPSYEPPHEVWIAHNTIVGNGEGQIDANVGSRLMLLRNIIVGNDPERPAIVFSLGGGARQVEGNVYWNTRPPLLREYEGGLHSVLADPMFMAPEDGDFRPSEGSPAYDIAEFRDALSAVLSDAPCGVELPQHAGASLPPASEAPQERQTAM